jgi:hypothetical protein
LLNVRLTCTSPTGEDFFGHIFWHPITSFVNPVAGISKDAGTIHLGAPASAGFNVAIRKRVGKYLDVSAGVS